MTTLFAFLFTLAILIVIHEFGHYLVARLAGVRVQRFSVGFGKIVASRNDRHGTQWALSAIPLGGYVKMLDEREAPVVEKDLPYAFNRQSAGKRIAIVAAGPLANLLLAVLLFWGLNMTGVPVLKPVIGEPRAGTPAAVAGMHAGETIVGINDDKPESWQDLYWLATKHTVRAETLTIETQDAQGHYASRRLAVPPHKAGLEEAPLKLLGLTRQPPPLPPVIGQLSPDGVGLQAGLKPGDRIHAVDAQGVHDWTELVNLIRAAPGRQVTLSVERAGALIEIPVTPARIQEDGETIGRMGASPRIDPEALAGMQTVARYGPWQALTRAVARTWDLSVFSVEMIGRMIVGQVSVKNLSGPITIADYAGQSAHSGVESFVAFLALISISLGVLNLLPVPLLDGGHLLYYSIEMLTGHVVPERIQEIGQKIGMVLLALLMFLALYNDLQRLFAG